MDEDDQVSKQLPVDESVVPLTADEVCTIVNRWSGQGFFRLRDMGNKIFLGSMERGIAYSIRLQTQYEHRAVRRSKSPFRGGPVDDRGRPPTPWEISVGRPSPFEERTEIIPVPHTERIQVCGRCSGQRRVTCGTCQGIGQTVCGICGGIGMVQSQRLDTSRDAGGQVITVPRMVQRPCTCGNGRVTCPTCQGSRLLTCPECAGYGSLKTFEELIVRFQVASHGELVDVTPVPDRWLAQRDGIVLLDLREPRIEDWKKIPDAASARVQELIQDSRNVGTQDYRMILQHLRVDRIAIHEIRYRYAGEEKRLWICGEDRAVYAPAAPWNRTRMYALFAAIVIPLACLLFWLLVFVF